MNEMQILDSVERYLNGGMSSEEKTSFEALRRSNPEVDQIAVEHTYFLQELEKFRITKDFKHSLHQIETKLADEGIIAAPKLAGKAKVVSIWKRHRRSIAVAASIAAFISLFSSGILFNYAKKQADGTYVELERKLSATAEKLNRLDKETANNTKRMSSLPTVKFTPDASVGGTGFLIDGKGYLVTNAHVIASLKNIYVENNKGEYFSAATVYVDKNCDLALLKINDSSFKIINNIPYSIKKGTTDLSEQFFTLGFPRNEIVYGEGYVSAKSGNGGDSTAYQLTVSANPGNSGGPVINKNGEIIGIITAKDSKADGVVYAAKSKNIYKLIDQLQKVDTTANQNIKTPSGTALKGLDRTQQVKKMEEFVFMVVGN
jgi:serine protease Do